MSHEELEFRAWVASRTPPVPESFQERLRERGDPTLSQAPEGPALALIAPALRAALAREGERGGAFRLLAADAWITWAAEAALSGDDPKAGLRQVLREVVRAAEGR